MDSYNTLCSDAHCINGSKVTAFNSTPSVCTTLKYILKKLMLIHKIMRDVWLSNLTLFTLFLQSNKLLTIIVS